MNSILTSVKKLLGIDAAYTQFDQDIIIHINTVFVILTQMGVGPAAGFSIADASSVWSDFTDDEVTLGSVRSYVFLKVRMIFDPPTNSAVMDAMNRTISELEWRLNVAGESLTGGDENA